MQSGRFLLIVGLCLGLFGEWAEAGFPRIKVETPISSEQAQSDFAAAIEVAGLGGTRVPPKPATSIAAAKSLCACSDDIGVSTLIRGKPASAHSPNNPRQSPTINKNRPDCIVTPFNCG